MSNKRLKANWEDIEYAQHKLETTIMHAVPSHHRRDQARRQPETKFTALTRRLTRLGVHLEGLVRAGMFVSPLDLGLR